LGLEDMLSAFALAMDGSRTLTCSSLESGVETECQLTEVDGGLEGGDRQAEAGDDGGAEEKLLLVVHGRNYLMIN
jgi:hypothetical protein